MNEVITTREIFFRNDRGKRPWKL